MEASREEELRLALLIIKYRENAPTWMWEPFLQEFFEKLKKFNQPLGHGTFSDYLESILLYGLGARKPKRSFSPSITSVCDLRKEDGLTACYAFATRNKTSALAMDAAKITGRDVISRYAEVNQFFKIWWKKFLLRVISRLYTIKRGEPCGFPTLLIYEGNNEAECKYINRNIPSEASCKTILASNALCYIFVPAKHVSLAQNKCKSAAHRAV